MSTVTVTVTVNGDPVELAGGTDLAAAVSELVGDGRGTAVVVNGEVVPRSEWPATALDQGDRVEVLRAAQGG